MLVYLLTLVAALLVGGASVIQQRAASQAPPEHNLSFKLLVWLAQRPLWLSGVACSVLGNLVFAAAVSQGSVALASALLTVRLLFALPLAAAWGRHSVPARDWAGAVAITGGLIGFILAARPSEGTVGDVPDINWIVGGGIVAAFVSILTAIGRRQGPTRKAPLLAAGAGALFGAQASLTRSAVHVMTTTGVVGLLTTWNGYGVVIAAVSGMLLVQSAYEIAPLPASYPAVVTSELVFGIGIGVAVLGGGLRVGPLTLAVTLVCLAVLIAGIYVLTTSPLVTGELDRLQRREEEGQARLTEAELERDLRRAGRDLDKFETHLRTRGPRRRELRHLERDLSRVHSELDRLAELQRDIRRHREAEREHLRDVPEEERADVAEDYESLPAWEREVDARAERLRSYAAEIEARARELNPWRDEAGASGE